MRSWSTRMRPPVLASVRLVMRSPLASGGRSFHLCAWVPEDRQRKARHQHRVALGSRLARSVDGLVRAIEIHGTDLPPADIEGVTERHAGWQAAALHVVN